MLEEFDRQVQNLIDKNFNQHAGISEDELRQLVEPLKERLLTNDDLKDIDLENGYLPFVIVIKRELVPIKVQMNLTRYNDKPGVDIMRPREPEDFKNLKTISIPESPIYLLIDVDRGKETINVTPEEAFKIISSRSRMPLTIEEGIAIITQYPDFLKKNNCFSLLASRYEGDQRVPAIWINAKKEANLGWCWDRNPHTWLGSASCKERIG